MDTEERHCGRLLIFLCCVCKLRGYSTAYFSIVVPERPCLSIYIWQLLASAALCQTNYQGIRFVLYLCRGVRSIAHYLHHSISCHYIIKLGNTAIQHKATCSNLLAPFCHDTGKPAHTASDLLQPNIHLPHLAFPPNTPSSKATHRPCSHASRNEQLVVDQRLPAPHRRFATPHLVTSTECPNASAAGLDPLPRGQRRVLIVCHCEIASVSVEDDIEARGAYEERKVEVGEPL